MLGLLMIVFLAGFNSSSEIRCKETKMVGWKSSINMTNQDLAAYTTAKKNCGKYYPKSPCLVKFTLLNVGAYQAICGASLIGEKT